jgi:hypothetical protein
MDRHRRLLLVVLATLLLVSQGFSQKKFGIGLMLGEPSGISWKYHLSSSNA